jgi:hypothetical protein
MERKTKKNINLVSDGLKRTDSFLVIRKRSEKL